ncbi:hypothetical protein ACFPH6_13775 [Streptomyces xiangluensis]|uniref:Multiple sugar transport system permease protein n=1 Tax=Streptomyces xiangluensis TaxID=2665720 RepID=A0ABV8YR22_9ACTN
MHTPLDHEFVRAAARAALDQTSGSSYGPMFAMSTLALVPTLICFLIFQKRLVEGLATSGMKG